MNDAFIVAAETICIRIFREILSYESVKLDERNTRFVHCRSYINKRMHKIKRWVNQAMRSVIQQCVTYYSQTP